MTDSRKAVVLLSGGMDSCVCTAMARERHDAENVALLHAGYGQRTQRRERRAFEEIAEFYSVRERLVSFLLTMSHRFGHPTTEGVMIGLPLKHQDIASSINSSRETTSRELSRSRRTAVRAR